MSAGKETIIYKSFEQLFNDAGENIRSIKALKTNKTRWYAAYSFFNLEFNNWLREKCGWDGGRGTYDRFLTKDFFVMFMQFKSEQEKYIKDAYEKEKQSWEINQSAPANEYTHRQYAIAERYKFEAGEINTMPTREQQRLAGGKKREQAYDSINPASAAYKPVKPGELIKAIELLSEYPQAQKLAFADLQKS